MLISFMPVKIIVLMSNNISGKLGHKDYDNKVGHVNSIIKKEIVIEPDTSVALRLFVS